MKKDIGHLMSGFRLVILYFLIVLFLFSCNKTDVKQEYIRAEIKLNVESYRKKRQADCTKAALDSANKIVDSIIFKQNLLIDSSSFLVKPVKPPKIIVKATIDTADVKPIVENRK